MNRELRLFLLAIALPSVLVAVGGARLLALEAAKDRADKSEANELRTAALAAGVERLVAEDARFLLAPLARETNTQNRIASAAAIAAADARVERISLGGGRNAPMPNSAPPPNGPRRRFSAAPPPPDGEHPPGDDAAPPPPPDGEHPFPPNDEPPPRGRDRVSRFLEFRTRLSTGESCVVAYGRSASEKFFESALAQLDGERPRSAELVFMRRAPLASPSRDRADTRDGETVEVAVGRTNARVRTTWGRTGANAEIYLAGGCLLAMLVVSFVAGGLWLARTARRERLDAMRKADFVDNVSHELKTPLAGIRLSAELLAEGRLPEGPRRDRALRSILSESDRLERLVGNLLDFGRLERGRRRFDLRRVDLADLVEARLREAPSDGAAADGASARFSFLRPDRAPVALADPDAVRQILENLLENAAKYAPDGGPPEVLLDGAGDSAELVVADRGPGIPRGFEEKVFERFFRIDDSLNRKTGGSGIGLALSRGLARGMGGDLRCRRRPGGGAEFVLTLPLATT